MGIKVDKYVTVVPGPMTAGILAAAPKHYWMRVYDFGTKKWGDWFEVSYSVYFEWNLKDHPFVRTIELGYGEAP